MSLLGRVVVVALVLGLPVVSDGAEGHGGKRDFPNAAKCPVHTGPVASADTLVFVARHTTAILTFLACDDRGTDFVTPLDISIDDLTVVDRAFFNAHQLPYADKLVEYGLDDGCYAQTPADTVFDRAAAKPRTWTMPLYESFEASPRGWTLVNAEVRPEDLGNEATRSGSLILARAQRGGQQGHECSMASVRLTRLLRNREYVVDFSWLAAGFDQDQDILTIAVDDDFPTLGGLPGKSLFPPAPVSARTSAAPPRR